MSTNIDVRGGLSSGRNYKGARLVVEMSPGLWEGRQFRAYRAFTTATQLRFTCAKDFVLQSQFLYCEQDTAAVTILTGAAQSGTWTHIATQQPKNRLTANVYVQKNFVEVGGTFTGGTERELLRADSGSGQGVGFYNALSGPRLLPAGTYYFNITGTGTPSGIYGIEWEEMD